MSYSYECNVICDGCRRAVCGESKESASEAQTDTERFAKNIGWARTLEGWICNDCVRTRTMTTLKTP